MNERVQKPFDLKKVQDKLDKVTCLEDITGANGVVQEMWIGTTKLSH